MSTKASLQYSRSAGRQRRLALDPVILVTVGGLLLAGLVMVSSASLSVAEGLHANLYFHFERQFFSVLLGCAFAAAVLVVGLMFGKDNIKLFVEPSAERIPQEIIADKNQLEFFESMEIIEALGKLEAQDEPKTDVTPSETTRASLRAQIV